MYPSDEGARDERELGTFLLIVNTVEENCHTLVLPFI